MSVAELNEAREKVRREQAEDDWPEEASSVEERADDPDATPEPEQEELFVLEQGRRVPLSKLIARGTSLEYRINLNSKSIPGGDNMGLLPYSDPDILLVVPARQGRVVHEPTFDEAGIVQKVVIRVNFKPLGIYAASSADGQALLGQE